MAGARQLTPLTAEQADRAAAAVDLVEEHANFFGRQYPHIGRDEFASAAAWDLCLAARRWREGRQPWRAFAYFAVRHACLNVLVKARRRPPSGPLDPELTASDPRRLWC